MIRLAWLFAVGYLAYRVYRENIPEIPDDFDLPLGDDDRMALDAEAATERGEP